MNMGMRVSVRVDLAAGVVLTSVVSVGIHFFNGYSP